MKHCYFVDVFDVNGESLFGANVYADSAYRACGEAYFQLYTMPDAYSANVYLADTVEEMELLKEFIKEEL